LAGYLSSRTAATDALVLPVFHRALVADLLGRRVAVIVAVGDASPTIRAVRAASATTPIVGFVGDEPVKDGIVASFNRPGGNVTGVVVFQTQTGVLQKRLGLLHDLLPQATTVAVLANSQLDGEQGVADLQDAARVLGVQLRPFYASTDGEIDAVFATLTQARPDALFVSGSPFFFARLDKIVASATCLALPTSFFRREFVQAGGLMSYASDTTDSYRIVGEYTGGILKGEKAGDLPIQQPTRLLLVLNLKTARALGLTVPTSMWLLADEIIE
jgi:putative ABC transport system substrate-binding protein